MFRTPPTLPKKYANWDIFSLNGFLTPQQPKSDGPVSFVRLLKDSKNDFDPKDFSRIIGRPVEPSYMGLAEITEVGERARGKDSIPRVVLKKDRLFINTAVDIIATSIRNAKKGLGNLKDENVSLFDDIPAWVAAVILQNGHVVIGREKKYLNLSESSVLESLKSLQITFEEFTIFIMHGRENEIPDWLDTLEKMKRLHHGTYSYTSLAKILQDGIKPEGAEAFMELPPVWLDELLDLS